MSNKACIGTRLTEIFPIAVERQCGTHATTIEHNKVKTFDGFLQRTDQQAL